MEVQRFVTKESCEDAMTTYIWPFYLPTQTLKALCLPPSSSPVRSSVCPLRAIVRPDTSLLFQMSFVKLSIFGTSFEVRISLHLFQLIYSDAVAGHNTLCRPSASRNGYVRQRSRLPRFVLITGCSRCIRSRLVRLIFRVSLRRDRD
jgi:hypothetical protein